MYKKGAIFFLTLLSCTCFVNAQKAITTAGAQVESEAGNISFVVGQIDYTTNNDSLSSQSVSKGVLQIYNRSSNIYTFNLDNTHNIQAWPNPVSSNLFIKIDGKPITEASYQVLDLNGQLVESNRIVSSNATIDMQKYRSGIYIVNIIYLNKKSVKFKIIKL